MKYTKDNIQGIICLYSPHNDGIYSGTEYVIDSYNSFDTTLKNKISWSIPSIIEALNNGIFKEIGNLKTIYYEIY